MKDALGDRIKSQYEDRTRYYLPRRTYTVFRIDGKAFHSYTRQLARPFDDKLQQAMDYTAEALLKEISGSKFSYTQSDEISILVTDFDRDETQAWFDGNIQKMVSVAASRATQAFNQKRLEQGYEPTALFDARAFSIADPIEVENYFVWRQKDAMKNSIQMVARTSFSQKELNGVSSQGMLEMIGLNTYEQYPARCRMGDWCFKKSNEESERTEYLHVAFKSFGSDGEREKLQNLIPPLKSKV